MSQEIKVVLIFKICAAFKDTLRRRLFPRLSRMQLYRPTVGRFGSAGMRLSLIVSRLIPLLLLMIFNWWFIRGSVIGAVWEKNYCWQD